MYKVFLNDRSIDITRAGKITLNITTQKGESLTEKKDVKKWFKKFINSNERKTTLYLESPEIFFMEIFRKSFKEVNAAGGVVVRKNKLLFIFRNKTWDLPKGKIDQGETADETAIREVQEECGIKGLVIVKQLPSTYHIYESNYPDSKGEWIFKETIWFEMKYKGKDKGKPQKEENITSIRWFKTDELDEVCDNTYSSLLQLITLYRD